jgi:hypothetical protein
VNAEQASPARAMNNSAAGLKVRFWNVTKRKLKWLDRRRRTDDLRLYASAQFFRFSHWS